MQRISQIIKKPQGIIPCGFSLFSGNHTSFMDIQLKMDRPVPLAAKNPKIDIMKTRYFFLALMSTVNDCMSFPPFLFKILFYYKMVGNLQQGEIGARGTGYSAVLAKVS
ncbi:hypothetical protein [[Bacillus] enclensis]|uniref:hypothetical protein n=1 Tax=[Bacillus] enclensis TaxID=1402860 RepID=UPI0018DD360D|nr:hypothetical protein [[Bacillus] enclensis]MBH9966027.1 hypothetical protein [[Bacillus] enclensis]